MKDTPAKTLDKATRDKVAFIAFIIPAFAEAYKMNVQDAYHFLKKYGGLDYLHENWRALRAKNEFEMRYAIYEICHQNGGPR